MAARYYQEGGKLWKHDPASPDPVEVPTVDRQRIGTVQVASVDVAGVLELANGTLVAVQPGDVVVDDGAGPELLTAQRKAARLRSR